jgi:hypothetical protein
VSGGPRVVFAVVATVLVLAAIAAGMLALGSPSEQRARRLDDRRLEDLRSLAGAIEDHWSEHRELPRSLDELPAAFESSRHDPETGEGYEYSVGAENRYRLCATFSRDATVEQRRPPPGVGHLDVEFWTHGAGRECFDVEARDHGQREP